MDIKEFTKRISRPAEKARNAVGFIKSADNDESTLLFSPGFGCERWIKIPSAWVDDADHLGEQACGDHAHHAARLRFKRELSADAEVAIDLLTSMPPPAPLQPLSLPRGMPPVEGLEPFGGLGGGLPESDLLPDLPFPKDPWKQPWSVQGNDIYYLQGYFSRLCQMHKQICLNRGGNPRLCNNLCKTPKIHWWP